MEEQFLETRYWTDLTDVLWGDQGLEWDDTTAYSETTLSTPSYTELSNADTTFTEL
tara:strand:+ start:860 stop:1027 length:168 start_codon:yes stop_codon:yes gene_type:complete